MSKFLIIFALHFEMHCDCGRRLSKGQASLPLHSPCTTIVPLFGREDRSAQAGGSEGLQESI